MKCILSLCAALLAITSTAFSGDVTIGLQTGAPALLGARVAYMGGTTDNRDLIVDGTLALTIGWTGNIGAGYALAGGPWYVGARFHYFSVDLLFVEAEGGAVGPEIGYIAPIFGSQNIYFNAFLGAAMRDDYGDLGVIPTAQIGLNIAL
jgi:hypothetical protein